MINWSQLLHCIAWSLLSNWSLLYIDLSIIGGIIIAVGAKAKTVQTPPHHHLLQRKPRHNFSQLPHLISNTDFQRNNMWLLLLKKSATVMYVNFMLSVSTLWKDCNRLRQYHCFNIFQKERKKIMSNVSFQDKFWGFNCLVLGG